MNWKFWLVIIILVVFLVLVINMHKKCKREGDKLGTPYRCKIFCSEPVTIIAEEHYYGKRDGKCFEFLDYGNNMSVKRVPMEKCGELEPIMKSNIIEDAIYTYND